MNTYPSDEDVLLLAMGKRIRIQDINNVAVPPPAMHPHQKMVSTAALPVINEEDTRCAQVVLQQQQLFWCCPITTMMTDEDFRPINVKTLDFPFHSNSSMWSIHCCGERNKAPASVELYSNATAAKPPSILMLSSTEKSRRSCSFSSATDDYHEQICFLHHSGDAFFRSNQYEQALSCYMNAMQIASGRHGPHNIDVVTALNCIGNIHLHAFTESKTGDITLASECFRRAFEILKFMKEDDSLYSAVILTNFGKALYSAGEYESAFSIHQEAYRIRKLLLEETHLDIAESLFHAAMSNDMLNNSLLSLHLYQKFLHIFVPKLGLGHSHVVSAYICSGDINMERQSYDTAIDMYTKGIDAAKKTFGHQDPIVADILTKIGHARYKTGDLTNAGRAYLDCLGLQRKLLASHDLKIVATLLNLAHVYQQEGYFEESLQVYFEALHLQIARNDQDRQSTLNTAVTLDCIGALQDILGRSNEGIESYERSLKMKISVLGRNHFEVSSILNAIGIIHFKEGRFESAISHFEKGVRIRESLPHSTSHDSAAILFNIGAVHMATGDSDKALVYFKRTLLLEKMGGEANISNTMNVLRHIGNLHANRREYAEALEYFNEGIQSIESSSRCDLSSELVSFYSLTGTVYLEQGDTENALRCLMKAIHHERIAGVSGDHDVILRGLIMKRLANVKQVTCAPAA